MTGESQTCNRYALAFLHCRERAGPAFWSYPELPASRPLNVRRSRIVLPPSIYSHVTPAGYFVGLGGILVPATMALS